MNTPQQNKITSEDFQDIIIKHFGHEKGDAPAYCADDLFKLAQDYHKQNTVRPETMTIEQAKDKVANDIGLENWNELIENKSYLANEYTPQRLNRYVDFAIEKYASQFSEPSKSLDREELLRWVEKQIEDLQPTVDDYESGKEVAYQDVKSKVSSLPHKEDKRLGELTKQIDELKLAKKETVNLLMRKVKAANDLVLEREKEIERLKEYEFMYKGLQK